MAIGNIQQIGRATAVHDMSRGSIVVRSDWSAAAGTEVQMARPGTDGMVSARIVWSRNGMLVLAFGQDAAMLRRVDQAMASVGGTMLAAA